MQGGRPCAREQENAFHKERKEKQKGRETGRELLSSPLYSAGSPAGNAEKPKLQRPRRKLGDIVIVPNSSDKEEKEDETMNERTKRT